MARGPRGETEHAGFAWPSLSSSTGHASVPDSQSTDAESFFLFSRFARILSRVSLWVSRAPSHFLAPGMNAVSCHYRIVPSLETQFDRYSILALGLLLRVRVRFDRWLIRPLTRLR